jgi:hypothetical protein
MTPCTWGGIVLHNVIDRSLQAGHGAYLGTCPYVISGIRGRTATPTLSFPPFPTHGVDFGDITIKIRRAK